MKKLYFCTNTKMFKGLRDTEEYLRKLTRLTADLGPEKLELAVMPPFTALYCAGRIVSDGNILLGAQNVCGREGGEMTGEISPGMLTELGVKLVMVGHSERRRVLQETDEELNQKALAVLGEGMMVLFCVGETQEDKENGISDEVLRMQLKKGLRQVPSEAAGRLRILYEPVWAVGVSGVAASPQYAGERHRVIKKCLCELYGEEKGMQIPVIFGGSVSMENARSYISMEHVDGLGIGRNAWDAGNFNSIIRQVMQRFEESGRVDDEKRNMQNTY